MKEYLKKIIVFIITWEAQMVLRKYKPRIVAITGSVGKTTTKDAIFSVVSHFTFARKSEKSYNSEIGVPLTILGCKNAWSDPIQWFKNILEGFALILLPNHYPKWLVLEVGADRPGDIKSLSQWIHPDITVVTRLSKIPVHVEFFPTVEALYEEKGFIVQSLKKDGVLILNADDEDVLKYRELFDGTTLLYGKGAPADLIGSSYALSYDDGVPQGISFDVSFGNKIARVLLFGGLGIQQMYPALAACAVAVSQKFSLDKASKAFASHNPPLGRMRIISGVKDSTIIDDSYNSSPIALHEAIATLGDLKTSGRKIAVLGDMLELGTFSVEEHKKAGEHVAQVVDMLFTVGVRARGIAEGALNKGLHEEKIFQFEDSRLAGKELEVMLQKGDIVLVKGSQGVRMEKCVEEIMKDPLKKEELLVRQDEEWKNR